MKRFFLVGIAIFMVSMGTAAPNRYVALHYSNFSVSFNHQLAGKLMPFIDGELAGNKERIGIFFGNGPATSSVLEILDEKGTVLRSLSVNDILGKGISKEENILPFAASLNPRRAENIYTIGLPQGQASIIVKAIATGDETKNDQELVVTFALSSKTKFAASLRLMLPFTGVGETGASGIAITSKSGTAAVVASVFPYGTRTAIDKGKFIITSAVRSSDAIEENPFVWLVIKGVSSSSSEVKSEVQKTLTSNFEGQDEPRLVVVNTADKERLQQSDTAAYTIICTNVGTGDASNVILGNPIPRGTKYILNSATTNGTKFEVTKGSVTGEDDSLKWMLVNALKPGEERMLSFKLVLQ